MRMYLAGALQRREYLRTVAAELRAAGVTITSQWLDERLPAAAEDDAALARRLAYRDTTDIENSDTFVVFSEPFGSEYETRVGHQVEMGYALRVPRMRVVVVGDRRSVFAHLAEHYATWPEARAALLAPRAVEMPIDPSNGVPV